MFCRVHTPECAKSTYSLLVLQFSSVGVEIWKEAKQSVHTHTFMSGFLSVCHEKRIVNRFSCLLVNHTQCELASNAWVCVCVVLKSEWYWYAWVTHTDDAFERRRQTIAWHAPKTKTLNQFSFFLPSQIKWRRALTLLLLQTMFASFSNLSIFIERLLFSWPFLVSFNGELEIERHCINFNSISIRWRRNERQKAR